MEQLLIPIIAAAIVVVAVWGSARYVRGLINFRRFDFNWYRREFPHLVQHGQVTCYSCGSNDMGIERKLQQTYVRSHVCRRCGTTLYYSREQ